MTAQDAAKIALNRITASEAAHDPEQLVEREFRETTERFWVNYMVTRVVDSSGLSGVIRKAVVPTIEEKAEIVLVALRGSDHEARDPEGRGRLLLLYRFHKGELGLAQDTLKGLRPKVDKHEAALYNAAMLARAAKQGAR